jgi:hypothetical protein
MDKPILPGEYVRGEFPVLSVCRIEWHVDNAKRFWIPASAGMTGVGAMGGNAVYEAVGSGSR